MNQPGYKEQFHMMQAEFVSRSRSDAPRRMLASAAIAVILAGGGGVLATTAASEPGRGQDRQAIQSRSPQPDSASVSPDARRSYDSFWRKLPKSEADAFERELNALEARQRRGDAVERDLEKLRKQQPEFFQMSTSLQSVRWVTSAGGGGTQAATYTCTGLSWIGRNGRLRCLGKLVVSG